MKVQEKKQEMPEERLPEAAVFHPARVRSIGPNLWRYRHPDPCLPPLPEDFWNAAKSDFGMRDGDVVIFTAGGKVELIMA